MTGLKDMSDSALIMGATAMMGLGCFLGARVAGGEGSAADTGFISPGSTLRSEDRARGVTSSQPPRMASGGTPLLKAPCHFQIFTHMGSKEAARDKLEKYAPALAGLLAKGSLQGVLILYVAPPDMWKKAVDLVSSSDDGLRASDLTAERLDTHKSELMQSRKELEDLKQHCDETMRLVQIQEPSLKQLNRVRVVSPLDFVDVLDYIKSRQRDNFRYWFQQTTYDVPKLVDAILRLRGLGSSCPVMRFDQDVLFNDRTEADGMALVAEGIYAGVDQHQLCTSDLVAQTWWFSGQYAGIVQADELGRFQSWSEAFSTRANPALLATPDLCNPEQFKDNWVPSDEQLDAATCDDTMLRFYGLRKSDVPSGSSSGRDEMLIAAIPQGNAEKDLLTMGNTYFGANPLRAVVSGSGFCVSNGLNLDLPPFSNFRLNVMWIDDHHLGTLAQQVKAPPLRHRAYCSEQHQEHLTSGKPVKARGKPANVAWYTLQIYLPTLLYGIIVDGWLLCNTAETTETSCLQTYADKFLPSDLAGCPDVLERIRALRAERDSAHVGSDHHGVLSRSILEIMHRGRPLERDKLELLKRNLRKVALRRCQEVYWQWRNLPAATEGGEGSKTADWQKYHRRCFASLWATGEIQGHPQLRDYCPAGDRWSTCTKTLGLGSGLVRAEYHARVEAVGSYAELPQLEMGDLNPLIAAKIDNELLEDALSYLDWIRVWPTVVQAVRSVNDGRLPSDVSFSLDADLGRTKTWLMTTAE